jgi:hypothetical protein
MIENFFDPNRSGEPNKEPFKVLFVFWLSTASFYSNLTASRGKPALEGLMETI